MSLPRVTVVMPVYHVEAYVGAAIESVLAQTFADFELLIIDDGGSDGSIAICAAYRDPRIRIVAQANRGLAGARNTGIAHARGDYIALLDSDDGWHPEKLALHVIHLDTAPEVGVSYSGSRLIDGNGTPLRQAQRPKLTGVTAADILCRNPVGNGSAAVIRRSALDAIAFSHPDEPARLCYFDERFRQSEDIELWVRMALSADVVFDGLAPLLTDYRIVSGGLSANVVRQFDSWLRMLDKIRSIAPDFAARHGPRARAYQLRYLARRSVQMGDGVFAAVLIRDAFAASARILWEEPVRTLATCAAVVLARFIRPAQLAWLARRWTGGSAVA